MAKGETKKTNQMLDQERAKTNSQFDQFTGTQTQRSGEAYDRSNQAYDAIFKGYSDMAGGKLLDPNASFGGGGGGLSGTYGVVKDAYGNFMNTGGVDAGAMRAGHGTLNELQGTGGYDAETRARIQGDIANYRKMAETGGVNEADRARMRGSGVFDEFAKTGGVSDKEAANLRARGNAPIASMFGGITNEMNRAHRIRGGSSAMGNAMALKMAREQSRAAAEASLGTELGISDRVREGRQWGAQGAAQSEGALQDLVTRNQLAGIGGASGTEMNMANSIANTRLGAATNLGASEQNIQGLIQRGKMYGTTGMEGIAGAETSAANAGAASSAADARFREGLRAQGLGGLLDLRGQAPGEVGMYDQNILAGIGGRGSLANDQLNMRYNAQGNNTSGWQQFGNVLGGVAGVAGGLMTGAGALRRPRPGGGG